MTQRDVARHLGVSQRLISDIEGGQRKVDCSELMALAEVYDVDPCWFLRGGRKRHFQKFDLLD